MSTLQKLLDLAESQVSYTEKNDAKNLDSFAVTGSGNYTKYARDLTAMGLMGCQGQAWCGTYQMWIECQAFGKETALEHLGPKFYNCFATRDWAKSVGRWIDKTGTPKPGYRVIFSQSHIALVTKVTATKIYTNEGNTSDSSGVNRDGGRVCNKSYDRKHPNILGYVKIDYEDAGTAEVTSQYEVSTSTTGLTVTATLNIRQEPGSGTVVGGYKPGDIVRPSLKVFVAGEAWFRTGQGWVSGKYLTGWLQELSDSGQRWWYVNEGYTCPVGVVREIAGKFYAFDRDGWMLTEDRFAESGEII